MEDVEVETLWVPKVVECERFITDLHDSLNMNVEIPTLQLLHFTLSLDIVLFREWRAPCFAHVA